jgi:hypothetical protein
LARPDIQHFRVATTDNRPPRGSHWNLRRYTASVLFVEGEILWMREDGETALTALEKLQRSIIVALEPNDSATLEDKADTAREVMELLQRTMTGTPDPENTVES